MNRRGGLPFAFTLGYTTHAHTSTALKWTQQKRQSSWQIGSPPSNSKFFLQAGTKHGAKYAIKCFAFVMRSRKVFGPAIFTGRALSAMRMKHTRCSPQWKGT